MGVMGKTSLRTSVGPGISGRLVLLLVGLTLLSVGQAESDAGGPGNELLIEFNRYSLKLKGRDPSPLVRIYRSGLTLVYRPAYAPGAGLYQTELPTAQVESIIRSIEAAQLDLVSSMQLAEASERAEIERQQRSGELYYTSDATISQLRVVIAGARADPLLFENLQDTARRHPQLGRINQFAALEKRLLGIAARQDLERVADPTPLDELR